MTDLQKQVARAASISEQAKLELPSTHLITIALSGAFTESLGALFKDPELEGNTEVNVRCQSLRTLKM